MPIWREFEESLRWKLSWYIDKTNPQKNNSMPISHIAYQNIGQYEFANMIFAKKRKKEKKKTQCRLKK
jgi:hypothetical protein